MGRDYKPIYRDVYELYELTNASDNNRRDIRRIVVEIFKHTYPDKNPDTDWLKLSEYERNRFLYVIIRERILGQIDPSKHDRLNEKLNKFIDKRLLRVDMAIHEYNDNLSDVFNVFYCQNDTADKMKDNYEKFCSVLLEYKEKVPVPTYDEWLKLNQIAPMRVYDYCQDYYAERRAMDSSKYIASQAEIDHVTLQTLLKILEKKSNIRIDTDLIEETITYIKNYMIEADEQLLAEYDSSLSISEEEQKEIIKADQKYMYYKEKLAKLDFEKRK